MENELLFRKRLRAARKRAGKSQRILGLEMGLEPSGASIRMNRYETGKRTPAFSIVCDMAEVLKVPPSYFYEPNDLIADIIMSVGEMDEEKQRELVEKLCR